MIRGLAVALTALASMAVADTSLVGQTYVCDRGVVLPVSFINPPGEPGLAVMMVEGKLVTLRSLPTGSGVRYVSVDEQDGYRLYTKGVDAFVAWLAADHTAEEVTILTGCRAAG
jgi:membrane-bound inhibitor of C-type lysozyme